MEIGKYIKQKSRNLGPAFKSLIPSTDEWTKNICIYAEWNDVVDSITNSIDMNLSKLQEIVKDREAWCAASMGAKELSNNKNGILTLCVQSLKKTFLPFAAT